MPGAVSRSPVNVPDATSQTRMTESLRAAVTSTRLQPPNWIRFVCAGTFCSLATGPSSIRGRDRRRVLATCTWKDAASHTSMPSLPSVAIRVPSGLYRKQ
jgi:hypothetical protein